MVRDHGLSADNLRTLLLQFHGRMKPLPAREYGLFANVIAGMDRTRMRTVRGRCRLQPAAHLEPVRVRGNAALVAVKT